MVTEEKAATVLADIAEWREEHLDEDLDERNVLAWLPEFGAAISVHGEDVDFVEDYYRYLLETEATACTGGAVVVTDVQLIDDEDHGEVLHFRRNGEPVWWHVEHESDDYVDQASVAEQISDLDPGGDDPRMFHFIRPEKIEACQDDVYLLATPEQARALSTEFDLAIDGLDRTWPRLGPPPTAEPGTAEWYRQDDRRSMTEPATEFLDRWLSDMDSALGGWRTAFLPSDFPYDFSPDSLDALEPLVSARFTDRSAVWAAADDPFVAGAVRYLGEILIRSVPSRWAYRDLVDSPYDRVPLIRPDTPPAFWAVVVPLHTLADAAADPGSGTFADAVQELRDAVDWYTTALHALTPEDSDAAPVSSD